MTRALLNLLTLLSLLLCAAVVAAWAMTQRTEAHLSLHLPGLGRYTFSSQYGELRVLGLPPPSPVSRRLFPIARRIRNDDVDWDVVCDQRDGKAPEPLFVSAWPRPGTACSELLDQMRLRRATSDDLVVPLVEALEDPNRFAAAHAMLTQSLGNGIHSNAGPLGPSARYELQGLSMELDVGQAEKLGDGGSVFRLRCPAGAVRIDAASRITVRDQWHAFADVPLDAIPYWPLAAAAFALPALRMASRLNRWRQARLGRCLVCGYDLRATPGRCPECGAGRSAAA